MSDRTLLDRLPNLTNLLVLLGVLLLGISFYVPYGTARRVARAEARALLCARELLRIATELDPDLADEAARDEIFEQFGSWFTERGLPPTWSPTRLTVPAAQQAEAPRLRMQMKHYILQLARTPQDRLTPIAGVTDVRPAVDEDPGPPEDDRDREDSGNTGGDETADGTPLRSDSPTGDSPTGDSGTGGSGTGGSGSGGSGSGTAPPAGNAAGGDETSGPRPPVTAGQDPGNAAQDREPHAGPGGRDPRITADGAATWPDEGLPRTSADAPATATGPQRLPFEVLAWPSGNVGAGYTAFYLPERGFDVYTRNKSARYSGTENAPWPGAGQPRGTGGIARDPRKTEGSYRNRDDERWILLPPGTPRGL